MKKTIHENHRIEVCPDTSQSLGLFRSTVRPGSDGYNELMRDRCDEIRKQILRHVDGLAVSASGRTDHGAVRIEYDTREECSFCEAAWEVVTAEQLTDLRENHPDWILPGDAPGLPACCDQAQDEWRETNAPLCTYISSPVLNPHDACDQYAEWNSDYCTVHKMQVEREDALAESVRPE